MSISTPSTGADPATPGSRRPRPARHRIGSLVRAERVLLRRNKLALFNAFVIPLLPFALLIPIRINGNLTPDLASLFLALSIDLALLFVVYYNVLSTFVARREELVLKRLRTGECSDREIIAGLSLPAIVITVLLTVVMGVLTVLALGQPLPVNPVLVLLGVLGGCLVFIGLALATTVFTKNAEATQITSLPVVAVCMAGVSFGLGTSLPDWLSTALRYTPLAPTHDLVRLGWAGLTADGGTVGFAESFSVAWIPVVTLVAWIVAAGWVAQRYFRWEPRT